MIILKVLGICWSVLTFMFLLKRLIVITNEKGADPYSGFIAVILVWLMVGVFPVLIIKLGWRYL